VKDPDAQKEKPASATRADLTFEEAIKRLSEIVQRLERGDLPLEESLLLFEEGVGLSRASQGKLDTAQRRVEELLGVDREGKPRTAPFELRGDRDEK
jgi:exodeoxyribonuclease VII small subunit